MTIGLMRHAITSRVMNLYLGDDMAKGALVARLRAAGHQVIVPADVSLSGAWDPRHLLHAIQHVLALVSRNHDDFKDLHLLIRQAPAGMPASWPFAPTMILIETCKDGDIARALRNLETAGVPIANEFHILNHWR
jgi:Domain of unknown function (DUF5615)